MGRGTRPGGLGWTIDTFWPDDTDTEFYVEGSCCLGTLLELAQAKWGDVDFNDITIHPEYIHTDCITYDLHAPSDWTYFLRVSKA